jgi:L-2-hydroxyglutarate oxidase
MPRSSEVIILGGGIVGLASALRIMQSRPVTRLTLIGKEANVTRHQTGHNSGVIHYPLVKLFQIVHCHF